MKKDNNNLFSVIRRAFAVLDAPTRRKSMISALLALVNAALEALSLVLVYPLVLTLTEGNLNTLDSRLSAVKDIVLRINPDNPMLATSILILSVMVLKNLFYLGYNWWQLGFVNNGLAALSEQMLSRYLRYPYLWHLKKNSAELQRNVTTTTGTVFNNIVYQTLAFVTEAGVILGAVSALIYMEPTVSILFLVFVGSAGLMYTLAFNQISLRKGRVIQETAMNAFRTVAQALGAYKEARLLGRESELQNQFKREVYRQAAATRLTSMISQLPRAYLELALVIVVLFGLLWISAEYPPSSGIALVGLFVAAAFRILPIISRVLSFAQTVKVATAALEIIETDLKIDPTSTGDIATRDKRAANETIKFDRSIDISDVTFRFPDNDEDALADVSFTIGKGECIGIVGPTGAGKSTLVDIIMGFVGPDKGSITIDEKEISGNPSVWNGALGYVPQSIYLLDDTIRRNVAFGIKDENIEDGLVKSCLAQAQILDFVEGLPHGLDTEVGERGVRLSGGQRQRIGIARALYSQPQILIMDEGTSALDGETEARLSEAIEQLRGDKTIILIAHRLSTVKHCDRIVFLEAGRISGIGNFDQLRTTNSNFEVMVRYADVSNGTPIDEAPRADGVGASA